MAVDGITAMVSGRDSTRAGFLFGLPLNFVDDATASNNTDETNPSPL